MTKHDPFRITGPTCISFSGGRTSAYMLWRVLQAHDMSLPDDAVVCFANTGAEEDETLDFVNECSIRWSVPITWVEYVSRPEPSERFKVVSYETANRAGQPFEDLIRHYAILPNVRNKSCTAELKIRAIGRYLESIGWDQWDSMIGMRADEPRRAAKLVPDRAAETPFAPLVPAGVTVHDVSEFWRTQQFQLNLPSRNGRTTAGNCRLCFLKPPAQILSLIVEKPDRATWWIKMEALGESLTSGNGSRFSLDRPSYAQMAAFARDQRDMFDPNEEAISCFCGD